MKKFISLIFFSICLFITSFSQEDEDFIDEEFYKTLPNQNFKWTIWEFWKYDYIPVFYYDQLNELATFMKRNAKHTFLISGHTDCRGLTVFNKKMSLDMANYIRYLMINRGVDSTCIEVSAKCFSEPIFPKAKNETEHQMNRRVEITFFD